jgi:HAD domain in Swiss Army Knife RNA repair proteins
MFPQRRKTRRGVKEAQQDSDRRPILFIDIDGVISLYGFPPESEPPGRFHSVDGILHCIGSDCGPRLERLAVRYELVWASGWEEKANEYLPRLLQMPDELPVLTFDGRAVFGTAHWKLEAIAEYAGDRPAAWIDDSLDERCERWAQDREAPTLLVQTESAVGMTDSHVERLLRWADELIGADGH